METDAPQEKKQGGGNKKLMIIGIAVVAVLVIVGVVLAVVLTLDDDSSDSSSSGSGSGGSGGDGSTTVNLEVSAPSALNNLDVATFIEARQSKRKFTFNKAIDPSTFAAGADYNTDNTRIYVDDSVQEPISTVQSIICQIEQAGIGYFMPVGDETETFCYLATVDESLCNDDNDDNQPSFTVWTLCNTNDVENGVYQARVWLNTGHAEIYAHLKVSHSDIEVVSDDDAEDAKVPRYNVSWVGCMDLSDEDTCLERGYLSVYGGPDGYDFGVDYWQQRYWEWDQDSSVNAVLTEAARGVGASATDSGHGVVVSNSHQWDQEANQPYFVNQHTYFAYEDQYLLKRTSTDGSNDEVTQCLDRDSPMENGNRYRAYTSSGAAVEIVSGRSIFIEDGDGARHYGYASYWGVWGDASMFVDGATVKMHDWSTDTTEEATLRIFSGQMYAIERGSVTLDEIAGLSLGMWTGVGMEKKAHWDSAQQSFVITHERGNDYQWEELDNSYLLVVGQDTTPYGGISLNSEGIGGHAWLHVGNWYWNQTSFQVEVDWVQPTGQTVMSYEVSEKVAPDMSGSSMELFCHENCYNPADPENTRRTNDEELGSALHAYTFDHANYELEDEASGMDVTIASSDDYEHASFNLWANTTANWAGILCDGSTEDVCPSRKFGDIAEFYRWETGSQNYHKATALIDGDGNVITFDRPVRIEYIHQGSTSNSETDYSGNKFFLELHSDHIGGLPYICLSINQQVIDCDSSEGDDIWRHVSDISIPEGTVVADETDSSIEFIIKPLEISQIMLPLSDSSACDSITLDTTVPTPTEADYQSPLDGYTKPTPQDVLVEVGTLLVDCATYEGCNDIGNLEESADDDDDNES